MTALTPLVCVDESLQITTRLRKRLKNQKSTQIRSSEERSGIKSVGQTWFNTYRPLLESIIAGNAMLEQVNTAFMALLEMAERDTSRVKYVSHLGGTRTKLNQLRSIVLARPAQPGKIPAPDFSPLVPDPKMQLILKRRWDETQSCLQSSAHLAATVMMGGMLEGLILARINSVEAKLGHLEPVFKSPSVPKSPKTGKSLPLSEWKLTHYLDVAHDLKWIAQSAKHVGTVLREYRNFIHPHKELTHGVVIDERETEILWPVFESLTRQILASSNKSP